MTARAAQPSLAAVQGVTSRAKQQQVNVSDPIRGFLATEHVLDAGEPFRVADLVNPRAEAEIVFVTGQT